MNLIRNFSFLLMWALILVGCNKKQYSKEQVRNLLRSVETQYQSMEAFELEGAINTTVRAPGQNQNMSLPVYYARNGPGNLRIEIKSKQVGMLNISNDSTTWSYIPSLQEYKKEQLSMFQTGNTAVSNDVFPMPGSGNIPQKFSESLKNITRGMQDANILGEETVTMADGSEKEALKIEVTYKNSAQNRDITRSPTTYVIDKKDYVVLRQSMEAEATEQAPRGPFKIYQTYVLQSFNLSPSFSDSVFVFNPPPEAREVEELSLAGMQTSSESSPLVGKKAINFELISFSGETISLDDLRGKVVILDFWATWCGPCREAHPNLQNLYEDLSQNGLVVLGINSETEQKVQPYMQNNSYTFSNLKDPGQAVAGEYQVNSIPSVFIIDRQGIVSNHLLGYQTEAKLRKAVDEAGL